MYFLIPYLLYGKSFCIFFFTPYIQHGLRFYLCKDFNKLHNTVDMRKTNTVNIFISFF